MCFVVDRRAIVARVPKAVVVRVSLTRVEFYGAIVPALLSIAFVVVFDADKNRLFFVADAIIVTSDSVNMASEAAITGKPVLIAGWNVAAGAMKDRVAAANVGERGRIAAFHRRMIAAGHTAPLATELPRAPFTALDEMDAVCKRVLNVLWR